MASDEQLLERLRLVVIGREGVDERTMFGGKAFMCNGHMMVAAFDRYLVARIGPEAYAKVINDEGVSDMDLSGRKMKGWVKVDPDTIETMDALDHWVNVAESFVRTLKPK